jgi:hypothetical protein
MNSFPISESANFVIPVALTTATHRQDRAKRVNPLSLNLSKHFLEFLCWQPHHARSSSNEQQRTTQLRSPTFEDSSCFGVWSVHHPHSFTIRLPQQRSWVALNISRPFALCDFLPLSFLSSVRQLLSKSQLCRFFLLMCMPSLRSSWMHCSPPITVFELKRRSI